MPRRCRARILRVTAARHRARLGAPHPGRARRCFAATGRAARSARSGPGTGRTHPVRGRTRSSRRPEPGGGPPRPGSVLAVAIVGNGSAAEFDPARPAVVQQAPLHFEASLPDALEVKRCRRKLTGESLSITPDSMADESGQPIDRFTMLDEALDRHSEAVTKGILRRAPLPGRRTGPRAQLGVPSVCPDPTRRRRHRTAACAGFR